jgi:hypothetical protein
LECAHQEKKPAAIEKSLPFLARRSVISDNYWPINYLIGLFSGVLIGYRLAFAMGKKWLIMKGKPNTESLQWRERGGNARAKHNSTKERKLHFSSKCKTCGTQHFCQLRLNTKGQDDDYASLNTTTLQKLEINKLMEAKLKNCCSNVCFLMLIFAGSQDLFFSPPFFFNHFFFINQALADDEGSDENENAMIDEESNEPEQNFTSRKASEVICQLCGGASHVVKECPEYLKTYCDFCYDTKA